MVKLVMLLNKKPTIVKIGPDHEGLHWFQSTQETIDLEDRLIMGKKEIIYSGNCVDTGEYMSPAAHKAEELMNQAPQGTDVIVISVDESVGTRTYKGKTTATYYS